MLNPFSGRAMRAHAARFDAALANYGGPMPRAFYHDSYEYQCNWADDLFEEFERRRARTKKAGKAGRAILVHVTTATRSGAEASMAELAELAASSDLDIVDRIIQRRPSFDPRTLMGSGKLEEAIDHYSEALRIEPNLPEAHYNLGNALMRQGRTEEAMGHYYKTLRIDPDHLGAHYNVGVALAMRGDRTRAAYHFSEVSRIDPGNFRARQALELLSQ